jgi:hypothetical protein
MTAKEHFEEAIKDGLSPKDIVFIELIAEQTKSNFFEIKTRYLKIHRWVQEELYGVPKVPG